MRIFCFNPTELLRAFHSSPIVETSAVQGHATMATQIQTDWPFCQSGPSLPHFVPQKELRKVTITLYQQEVFSVGQLKGQEVNRTLLGVQPSSINTLVHKLTSYLGRIASSRRRRIIPSYLRRFCRCNTASVDCGYCSQDPVSCSFSLTQRNTGLDLHLASGRPLGNGE